MKKKLETKINGKIMKDLCIHNMVSVEHIVWLIEMKIIENKRKKEEKTGFNTNERITET